MKDKIKRNIFITLLISVVIYFLMVIYGDYSSVLTAFKLFNWKFIPLIFLIIYVTFLLKFLKWQYYLKLIGVNLKLKDSFHIFMASLTMSFTPGKIGDFIKSYMVREIDGTAPSKTIPIIFADKITEFAALIVSVMIGVDMLHKGIIMLSLSVLMLVLLLYLVLNNNFIDWFFLRLKRIKLFAKYIAPFNQSLLNSQIALKPKPFFLMFLLSLLIWIIEAAAFFIIIYGFQINIGVSGTFFTYFFSIFVGSVSFFPAGLGITDGSIAILLTNYGIHESISISVALIIRVATLWFAMLVGSISMLIVVRRNKNLINNIF